MDAFFDAHPPVDHNTRVLVTVWVMALLSDPTPADAVTVTDQALGTVYRAIVGGTDVEVTFRILATGTPRLLTFRRLA